MSWWGRGRERAERVDHAVYFHHVPLEVAAATEDGEAHWTLGGTAVNATMHRQRVVPRE